MRSSFMMLIGAALALLWGAIFGLGYLGWRVYSLYPRPVHWIIALYALSFVIAVVLIGIRDNKTGDNDDMEECES